MSKATNEIPQLNSPSNGLQIIPKAIVRISKKKEIRNKIGKILSEVSDNEGEEEEQQHQDQTPKAPGEQINSNTQHLIECETAQEQTEKQQQQQSFGSKDESHLQPLQLIVSSPTAGVLQLKQETNRRSSLSSSRMIGSQPPNLEQLSTTALKESFQMNRTNPGGNSTLQITNGGSIRNLLHNHPSNSSYYTRSAIPGGNSSINKNASIINNTTHLRSNSSSSSLLTTEKDVKYLNSLRGSQLSFHDALNKLNYESHLDDSKYSDLFSNRNALLDTLQESEINHINECPVPRKYDDFHVTEGIIPNIISKNRSEHQQESTNSQERLSFVEQLQLICEPQETATAKSKEHLLQVHSKTATGQIKKESQLRVKVSSLHQSSSTSSSQSQLPHKSESSRKIYNKTLDSFNKFFLTGSPNKNPSNLPAISVNNNNSNNMFSTRSSLLSSSHKPSSSAISSSNRSLPVRKELLLVSPINPSHNPSIIKTKDIIHQLLGSTSTNLLSRSSQHHSSVDLLRETISVELKNKTTKRQEILNVRRWLDEKLHGLVKREELKINEVFTYLQNVFQACLSEMLRQINAECRDRGELLQEIWDSQVTLSEKIFISISNESAEIEMKSLQEINRLHKHYQFELGKQFEMVDEKDKTLFSYKTALTKAVQENRLIRKKGQRLEKNFKIINNQMNQLQEEYNMLFQENLALLMNTRQINWDAAMNEKRRMLEEMNANKKLRNNLMKGGVEVNDDDLTPEAKTKKLQIDQLVKQFVIDRESNMPIEMLLREEEDEPYEMDEYRQPVVNAFWREISTDTVDLVAVRETWTNTDRLYLTDLGVNTEKIECADAETEMGDKSYLNGDSGVASIMTQTDLRIVYAMMTQTELNVEDEEIQCEILVDHDIMIDEENNNNNSKKNNEEEDNSKNSPTNALTPSSAENENVQPLQFISDSKQEEQQEAMLSSVKSAKNANSNQKSSRKQKLLKQGGSSLNKKTSVSRYSNDQSPLSASPSQFQISQKMMLEQQNSRMIQQQSSLTSNNSNSNTNTNTERVLQQESNDDKNQEKGEQTTKNAKRTSKQGNYQTSKKNSKKQRDSIIGESGSSTAVGGDPGESLFMTGIIETQDTKLSAVISQDEEKRNNFLKKRSESIRKELESEAARKIRVAEIQRTEEEAKRIFWIENEAEERSKEEIAQMKDWANKAVQKQRELTRQLEITQIEQGKKNEQILQNNQEIQAKDTEIMKLNEIIKQMQIQVQSRQNRQSVYANSIHRNSLNSNGGGESPRNNNTNRRNKNTSDQDKQNKQQVMKHSDSIKSGLTSRMNTINDNEDRSDNGNVRRDDQAIDQRRRSAANYESNRTTLEKSSYSGGRNGNSKPARPQSSLSFQSQRKQEQDQKQLFNNQKSKMSLFGANKSNFQQKFNRNNNNNGQNNNAEDNNSSSSRSSSSSKSSRKAQNQVRSRNATSNNGSVMINKERNMFNNSKINERNDGNRLEVNEQNNMNNNHNNITKNPQNANNTTNIFINSPRPNKLSIDEELLSEYIKNESNRNSLFEERLSNNLSDFTENTYDANNYDYNQNSDEHLQAVEYRNNRNWRSQSRLNLKVKIVNQRQSDIVHMVDMTPIVDNHYEQSMPMNITGSNGKINNGQQGKSLSKGRQAQNIINTTNHHHREHSNSYSLPSGSPMIITPPPSTRSIADSIVKNSLGFNSNNSNNNTPAIHVQVNNRQTQQQFTRESVNLLAAGAVKDRIQAQGSSSINAKKNAFKFYPQIVKIMNSVVSDSLKNMKTPWSSVSSMHVQAYEHFLYIFGLRKVAEIKLQQLLQQAILLKDDYSLVNIFIQLYFKDAKGTQLGFICQMQSLISENAQTVKLEKGITSKYRVLLGVMSLFKSFKVQKEVLKGCFNDEEIEELIKGQDQQAQNKGAVQSSRNDLLIGLSNERINELSSQKLELLDALRDCLQGFRRFKSGLAGQYFGVYQALVSSTESVGIDRNGVELIMMVLRVDQEAISEIVNEFNKQVAAQNNHISSNSSSTHLQNIHNRTMNFEQFCVFASEFENIFATEYILKAVSNDLRSLEDIKLAWDHKKSQQPPLACPAQYSRFSSYFQAICEKLDILAALLNEDFQENSEYLTKHEASFQIGDVILSRMVGKQTNDEQDRQDGI